MTNRKKLVDVFPDVLINGGIFKALEDYNVPWKTDIDDVPLDLEYFYNISGQKFTSPLVNKILSSNPTLTANNINSLAGVIYNMFGRNWSEIYSTMNYEYDPLVNYDMSEEETTNASSSDTATHTGTQSTTHTGTQGTTDTETVTGSGSGSTENGVYAFNSADAVGDTESGTTTTNSNTASGSSTRTDNLTDARTDNLTDTGTGTREETRTLTRSGNIGVMTAQSLISEQRSLWLWNFIYNVVFPDIDKVLTIATYSNV